MAPGGSNSTRCGTISCSSAIAAQIATITLSRSPSSDRFACRRRSISAATTSVSSPDTSTVNAAIHVARTEGWLCSTVLSMSCG